MDYTGFIKELDCILNLNKDYSHAVWMNNYMRGNFQFLGIKKPKLKIIFNDLLQKYQFSITELELIVKQLFIKEYREYQYVAIFLLHKQMHLLDLSHITLFEYIIKTKSWWDSIDIIAPKLLGGVLSETEAHDRKIHLQDFANSKNIWMIRSAVIHQLNYKGLTDTNYLAYICKKHSSNNDFFVKKAIGWALREYSKTKPEWVEFFVQENKELSALSRREALAIIKNSKG